MTEKLTIERTAEGGLSITLETALGQQGALIIAKKIPPAPGLKHLQVLELQADLMAEAVALLQQKLKAARLLDSQPPTPT